MSLPRILVTGSSGLVGSTLVKALRRRNYWVTGLDCRASDPRERGDIRDEDTLGQCIRDCDGIIHLAAVSRVVAGERDPQRCWATNVDALRTLVEMARTFPRQPWIVFASSREVYGHPASLPVDEGFPLDPINVYGRSKLEGEKIIQLARSRGMRACTIRLSNVFGSVTDYSDRVVPAFARAAVTGDDLRVEGRGHTFDFTHVSDVAAGIVALVDRLVTGCPPPPPIQFVSGVATTLGALAEAAIAIAGAKSVIHEVPPRSFDVAKFVGCGARAKTILGWEPKVTLRAGLEKLINEFRSVAECAAVP